MLERGVAEDDVGRHVLFACNVASQSAQGFKERPIIVECCAGQSRRGFLAFSPGEGEAGAGFEEIVSRLCDAQGGVFPAVFVQETPGDQQPCDFFEVVIRKVVDNAVHAEFVVPEFSDAFDIRPPQHLADMADAEPLVCPHHSGQHFLRDDRGVECLCAGDADVASPAIFFVPRLTEIG